MWLIIVVLILIVLLIYKIVTGLTPNDPPIDDIETHSRKVMQFSNKKRARQFIKDDAKRRRGK